MAVTTDVFTTPGAHAWTWPSGVHSVLIRMWGPGGPSAGGQVISGVGDGGAGGEYREVLVTGNPGDVENLNVGNGGTAGVAPGGSGIIGVATWFRAIGTFKANAGAPGVGANSTNAVGGNSGLGGTVHNNGGNGVKGTNPGGSGGGSGGDGGSGGNATGNTGGTAGPGAHPGAAGRNHVGGASVAGVAPGGGAAGGAASNTSNGAIGGAGRIEIEYMMTEDPTDTVGATDATTVVLRPFEPAVLLNDFPDARFAVDGDTTVQITRISFSGTATTNEEMWNWIRAQPFVLEVGDPGDYWEFTVPEGCFQIAFDGAGGRGGPGAGFGAVGTVGTGVGGPGSLMAGLLDCEPGDFLQGYVARRGYSGYDDPFCVGGEPGGAAPQENIFGHEFQNLGGTGGGLTSIWKNGVLMVVIAGGGAAGADAQAGGLGGDGGAGGGDVGQDGQDGTTNSTPPTAGKGGKGGTQTAGGDGGDGSSLGNGPGVGQPGGYLAGGSTARRGAYGTGTNPHPCAGAAGAGLHGGGGGGNGSDQTLVHGAAGGGAGGSDFHHPTDVTVTNQVQGGNTANDGHLTFTFHAKRTYDGPGS